MVANCLEDRANFSNLHKVSLGLGIRLIGKPKLYVKYDLFPQPKGKECLPLLMTIFLLPLGKLLLPYPKYVILAWLLIPAPPHLGHGNGHVTQVWPMLLATVVGPKAGYVAQVGSIIVLPGGLCISIQKKDNLSLLRFSEFV